MVSRFLHGNQMPDVLNVTLWADAPGDGVGRYLRSMQEALGDSEIRLHYAAMLAANSDPHVTYLYRGKPQRKRWIAAALLFFWLVKHVRRFDVIHIHGATGWQMIAATISCIFSGKSYLISPHGLLSEWCLSKMGSGKLIFFNLVYVPLLKFSNALVTTTDEEKKAVYTILGKAVHAETVVPCVTCHKEPSTASRQKSEREKIKLLFTGRIQPVKGLSLLFEALAALPDDLMREFSLLLVGSGPKQYQQFLTNQIKDLGLEDIVIQRGLVGYDEIPEFVQNCDLFVLPSFSENFSFSTAEALVMGKPVITTNRVAISNLVERYECGLVINAGSQQELTAALRAVALDPEILPKMGRNAHTCAETEFKPATMQARLMQIYGEVTAKSHVKE